MRCYKRLRPDRTIFYVDEKGNEVPEHIAKQYLVDESDTLRSAGRALGLSEKAAIFFARRSGVTDVAQALGMTGRAAEIFNEACQGVKK